MSKEKSDVSSMEVDDQISTNPKFVLDACQDTTLIILMVATAASLALGIKTEENSPPDDVSGAEAIADACKVQSSITFISNLTKDEVPDLSAINAYKPPLTVEQIKACVEQFKEAG
ncbi:hypothetical protein L2E82_37420 [Cichorium intybus]|uniref:Uncharacterized protein n=1 Tax=Cichorium intybus TaxID=13427 RepID=A0ACB9AF29_CICIN|nr:hypothetical protein L2E82_37420 [Cichorium intybus]